MPPKKSKAPRFPENYGRYLAGLIEKNGLDWPEIGKLIGRSYQTVYRQVTGKGERSMLSANKIRDVLMARGIDVDPVPGVNDGWIEPELRPTASRGNQLSPEAEIFRRNLTNFREEAGLADLHEGSRATGIAFETLRAYELGEQSVSGMHLLELARAYDRSPQHFEMADPPKGKKPPPAIYFRTVGSLDEMSPENRARTAELQRQLAEINADERRRHDDLANRKPPKRR